MLQETESSAFQVDFFPQVTISNLDGRISSTGVGVRVYDLIQLQDRHSRNDLEPPLVV